MSMENYLDHNVTKLYLNPCRFVCYLIAFIKSRHIVDSTRFEINTSMKSSVDMSAKHDMGVFPAYSRRQFR